MLDLIKNNQKYFEKKVVVFQDNNIKLQIAKKLNKYNLVIVSGLKGVGKTNIVSNMIRTSNYKNNYFYFNTELDIENKVKTQKDLFLLFSNYTKRYKKPSIVILENPQHIKGFKTVISKLYEDNYKIIIIANAVEISSKPNINIKSATLKQLKKHLLLKFNLTKILKYGSLENIFLLNADFLKEKYLQLQKTDTIFNDVVKNYKIQNFDNYTSILTFLSLRKNSISLRKIHKKVSEISAISLVTLIEYIDYSIESSIIYRMYPYDIKKAKEITTKAKYFFSDLGIRNSFNWYQTSLYSLQENLIYNELLKKGYKINSGINGKFEFSFLAKKQIETPEKIEIDNLYIHMSKQTEKSEIKKEIKKLLKIDFCPTQVKQKSTKESVSKFLIVKNLETLRLKKFKYEDVFIVSFEEFVKKTLI